MLRGVKKLHLNFFDIVKLKLKRNGVKQNKEISFTCHLHSKHCTKNEEILNGKLQFLCCEIGITRKSKSRDYVLKSLLLTLNLHLPIGEFLCEE